MNSKNNNRSCEHCVHAIKNYYSIGNKVFFSHVSACCRLEMPPKGTPFKMKERCLYFIQDIIPSPSDDIGQQLFYLYRQLDEITDVVFEILSILNSDEDGDIAPKAN